MKLISLFVIGVGVVHAEDVCGLKQLAPANTCWPASPNLKPNAQTDYTKDAATCCALCSNTGGCAGWTWGFDTLGPPGRWSCRLKRAITGTPTVQNCTSGYSGAPPSTKPHILYILAVSGASSVPVVIMLQQPHLVLASTFSDCVILCRMISDGQMLTGITQAAGPLTLLPRLT